MPKPSPWKGKEVLFSGEEQLKVIIIRCVFFFISIGRESTKWPSKSCLQIMVCSCVVPSKSVLLQIIFCSCEIGTPFSWEKWQIASLSCHEVIKMWKQTQWWSNDKTIIELGYRKISWFASVSQIFYLPQPSASQNNWSARGRQITLLYSWRFSRYSAPIHWLVHGHMTSNNETVSRQMPWVGNIAKTITSNGKQFTVYPPNVDRCCTWSLESQRGFQIMLLFCFAI